MGEGGARAGLRGPCDSGRGRGRNDVGPGRLAGLQPRHSRMTRKPLEWLASWRKRPIRPSAATVGRNATAPADRARWSRAQ
ncbi:hypothetical protein C8Q73DRAFT_434718 [Cubamyces lactineus]|nr:hypothetical protein C8Q73DRAFT_434718 [Cubamyces lactineus]